MNDESSDDIIEKFGRFKLVARMQKDLARGVLWRDGKKLIEVSAANVSAAYKKLHSDFYQLLIDKAKIQGDRVPEDADVVRALSAIWAQMTDGQVAMLRAHYHAPLHQMTATQLAQAAGYKGYSAANLWYGRAGWLLFGELPRTLPLHTKEGEPVFTSAIAVQAPQRASPDGEWIWEMRPEVARALKLAGLER